MHYGMMCGHRGARRRCCEEGGYGHPLRFRGWERHFSHMSGEGLGGAGFGVRRPLRFLAYKLQLNEAQVEELARVLNDLKTERDDQKKWLEGELKRAQQDPAVKFVMLADHHPTYSNADQTPLTKEVVDKDKAAPGAYDLPIGP